MSSASSLIKDTIVIKMIGEITDEIEKGEMEGMSHRIVTTRKYRLVYFEKWFIRNIGNIVR